MVTDRFDELDADALRIMLRAVLILCREEAAKVNRCLEAMYCLSLEHMEKCPCVLCDTYRKERR